MMATDRRERISADSNELATAIGLYLLGEISLGKASERVGLSRWEMQDLLEALDIDTRQGPRTLEELQVDVGVALELE
jgi:predicted HTH domain antitoxin